MRLRAALVLLLLLSAVPARADWNFTRWGMSVEEVMRAARGGARVATPQEVEQNTLFNGFPALVVSDFRTELFEFFAHYMFDATTRRLQMVTVTLKNPTLRHQLRTALSDRYGKPVKEDKGDAVNRTAWRDDKGRNLVELLDGGTVVRIVYSSINSVRATGL